MTLSQTSINELLSYQQKIQTSKWIDFVLVMVLGLAAIAAGVIIIKKRKQPEQHEKGQPLNATRDE